MTNLMNQSFRPCSELVFTAVGDEAVLLHTGSNTYFGLDHLGSLIFQRLANRVSPELIVEEIISSFNVGQERATSDFNCLLEDFIEHGILLRTGSDGREIYAGLAGATTRNGQEDQS